ncbi:MAG: AsmA family protein [Proteobacteria bacterium]|nr:AsmA family protein [Pseudomonadota bacterium]
MKRFMKIIAIIVFLFVALIATGIAYLMTVDFNEFKPEIQAEAKKATGRNLVIDGDLKLNIFTLTPGLAVNGVRFQNAAWGSSPDMAKIRRFEAVVSIMPLLSGAVEIRRVILEGAEILIEKNKAGNGNYEFAAKGDPGAKMAQKKAPAKSAGKGSGDLNLVVQAVTIKNAKLTYKDHNAPQALVLALENFTVKGKGKSDPLEIALKGAYNEAKFQAKGTLGSPAELLKPTKPWPIDLTAEAGGATVKVKGSIGNPQKASGINISLNIDGKDLSDLSEVTQSPVPALGPYSVAAKIAGDVAKSISLSGIKVNVGSSALVGKLNIVLAGRPRVVGGFQSDMLDLADFTKTAKGAPASSGGGAPGAAAPSGGAAKGQYVIPDTPLPVAGLKAVDADLEFDIKKLIAAPTTVENIHATLRLNNGDLKITPVKMDLAGGAIAAGLQLNASGGVPALNTNLSVKMMSLSKLSAQMGQKDVMDGDINIAMNLSGNGSSPRKIASGLNGNFEFTVGKGKIKTETMEELMGGFMTAITKLIAGNKPVYTVINCGVKKLEIRNGISTSKAMEFDADWIALVGGGTVNLKNEQIDYGVNPDIKLGGRSTTAPVKISGTLANPRFTVDALALAGQVGGKLLKGTGGALMGLVGAAGGGGAAPVSEGSFVKVAASSTKPAASPTKAITDTLKDNVTGKATDKVKEGLGDAVGGKLKGLFGR